MSGKPMDPKRLAHCRNLVKVATEAVPDAFIGETARNLRDALDRGDHWEAHVANIEDRLVECAERFAEAGLTGALRVVESAIAGRISNHAAKARVVRLTERAETAEAEAKRWRSQCPVTAEHVEAAGVSRVLAERWLHLAGVEPYDLMGHSTLWRDAGTLTHACTTSGSAADIATAISMLADDDPERCAHDILDEMATATPGGDQ